MNARVIVLSEAQMAALLGETMPAPGREEVKTAPPGWLTPEQYGAHSGFTARTIRAWCAVAPPAAAWKIGREWRLDGAAFDAWLKTGGPKVVAQALGRAQGGES